MTGLFDIVITTYNRQTIVDVAIQSALQANPNKVIVVDDASTDATFEMLCNSYKDNANIQLYRCKENLGVTGAKNKGFELSRADWVIFLDSDDTLITENTEQARSELNKAENIPILFFRCLDQTGAFVGERQGEKVELDLKTYIKHTSFGEALTAFNRSMDSSLPYVQDLRGYEGLGCARRIQEFGPALLSDTVFRIYNQSNGDRLSATCQFWGRSNFLAKGHLRFYKEFYCDMTMPQRANMLFKVIAYSVVSFLTKPFLR